jgi:hypothetical protein
MIAFRPFPGPTWASDGTRAVPSDGSFEHNVPNDGGDRGAGADDDLEG